MSDGGADRLKQEGNRFMKEKAYEKAIDSYTAAIQITPDNYYLYSNRSQAYINIKKYEEGLKGMFTYFFSRGFAALVRL